MTVVVKAGLAAADASAQDAAAKPQLPRIYPVAPPSGAPSPASAHRFAAATQPQPTPFVPRGANYIRLNGTQGTDPPLPVYHSTFSPKLANRTEWQEALALMAGAGFNVVRVFVDSGGDKSRNDSVAGNFSTQQGLSGAYLDNLATFVQDATAQGVYVMVTVSGIPGSAYWAAVATGGQTPWDPSVIAAQNAQFLHAGFRGAKARYVGDLLAGIKSRLVRGGPRRQVAHASGGAALSGLFAVSMENEACMIGNQPPFSWTTGNVTTADGLSYSMASAASRQQCADANAVGWTAAVASAAHAVDPHVMVTAGMFTFQAVGKAGPNGLMPVVGVRDPRFPVRPAVLSRFSPLAFLDVHVYPMNQSAGPDQWTLSGDLATEEWASVNFTRTPVVMCEFGAWRNLYASAADAADALLQLQLRSCDYSFAGWLQWTWDTWEQPRLFYTTATANATSSLEPFVQALSPNTRPDPCNPPPRQPI